MTYNLQGADEKTYNIFIQKPEGRNHFGDLDVGGRITLK